MIFLQIGWMGVAVMLIFVTGLGLQTWIDQKFKETAKERMRYSDSRGKRTDEILTGIKTIKFNAWERIMNRIVKGYRVMEGKLIYRSFLLFNISQGLSSIIPTLLGLFVFGSYPYFYGSKLTVTQIYELITLFNSTRSPMKYYIMAVMNRADALASSQRIELITRIETFEHRGDSQDLQKGEIVVKNGCFNWESSEYFEIFQKGEIDQSALDSFILKDINIHIKPGELVAIVGKVGSGKTSLLLAMGNEMVTQRGSVEKSGKVAFISQETFLRNDTILKNITFGKKYDKEKFKMVKRICQIESDLKMLPGEEFTEIGERGQNLSGGQRQRLNIARAVYSDSDIYCIDDALSALDPKVGKKIMQDVFKDYLKDKTRIISTQNLAFLDQFDRIILVDEGSIVAQGDLESIKSTAVYKEFALAGENKEPGEMELKQEDRFSVRSSLRNRMSVNRLSSQGNRMNLMNNFDSMASLQNANNLPIMEFEEEELEEMEGRMSMAPRSKSIANYKTRNLDEIEELKNLGKLTQDEDNTGGKLGRAIMAYMRNSGLALTNFCIASFMLSASIRIFADWWVGQWKEDSFGLTDDLYLEAYFVIGMSRVVILVLRSVFIAYVSEIGAINTFKKVMWNLLRRPLSFFDITPSGIILNRCTNDVDTVDTIIPWMNSLFLNFFCGLLGVLFVVSFTSPIVIVFILIGFLLFRANLKKFMIATIDLKRLNQLSAAPLINICSEYIRGAEVIRNYSFSQDLIKIFYEKADLHNKAHFHDETILIWIRFKLEMVFCLVIIAAVVLIVVNKKHE